MKVLGVLALAAGAMAQSGSGAGSGATGSMSPKVKAMRSNMVLTAPGGDVHFSTATEAVTISSMMSSIAAVPGDRTAEINGAIAQAGTALMSSMTASVEPLSTAVSNQGAALATASAELTAARSQLRELVPAVSTLQATAAQYTGATAPCNAANQGRMKIVSDQLWFCAGGNWHASYHEPLGTSRGSAADDCQAIVAAGDAPQSGVTTSWILQHGDSSDDGLVYQAKCSFSTRGTTTTGVSLGGDGSTPAQAGLSCASINNVWRRPTGVYWVSMASTMEASDDEDIVEVFCQGGRQLNGDGTDYRAPVSSCTALVTQFNEFLYDNTTGLPLRYWRPIATSVNIALSPNPVGPAIPSASSIYRQQGYNVQEINDGAADQGGDFLHGGTSGEAWPYVSLQLAAQADVATVRLYLRTGGCASRNMFGTGCATSYSTTTYSRPDQGFQVRVATEPCVSERQCPGTLCAWVRRMTRNSVYTVSCPAGTVGNYVHFQLPGENRMTTVGEIQVYARSAQQTCTNTAAFGNGRAATTPGLTCRTIQLAHSRSANGVYWVRPRADMDPFRVYCDMRTYGGGWTIAEQWTGPANNGQSYPLHGRSYNDILSRGYSHGYFQGRYNGRSLGKAKVNALWSVMGIHTIIRWDYSRTHAVGTCGAGLYQRLAVGNDWDVFHAMRDSREWDNDEDSVANQHWSYQYARNQTTGETYQNFQYYQEWRGNDGRRQCRTDGSSGPYYDRVRNTIRRSTHRDNMRFHQWEEREVNDGSGRSVAVSRHGVPGDPFEGCQWAFRFNSGRGQSWCRDWISNYLMFK